MKLTKYLIIKYWEKVAKTTEKILKLQPKFENIEETRNIYYCEDGSIRHTLNIFYTKNSSGKQPIIIDIHGGGWFFGEKEINDGYCMALAEYGFTVVNVDYTLAPANSVKEQIKEIDNAVKWVEENIEKFYGDTDKIVIAGDSAGGYLAAAFAAVKGSRKNCERYSVKYQPNLIKTCILTCGIYDFSFYAKSPIPAAYNYMKIILKEDYSRKTDISSIAALIDGMLPPVFMSSSEQDIFRRQSIKFSRLLKEKNIEHTFAYIPKGVNGYPLDHVFNVMKFYLPEAKKLNDTAVKFIYEHI